MPEAQTAAPPGRSPQMREAKRALRLAVIERRAALGEAAQAEASRRIAEALSATPQFRAARGVHCFLSVPGEIDTGPILAACAAAGKPIYVPIQLRAERRLGCARWAPGDPLVEGPYGIREPADKAPVDLAAIDLVLVPGAAFDRTGRRLGYGMGYYDGFLRTLADLHGAAGWSAPGRIARPAAIALAFAVQVVERVPTEPWDIALPALLTEAGLIPTAPDAP